MKKILTVLLGLFVIVLLFASGASAFMKWEKQLGITKAQKNQIKQIDKKIADERKGFKEDRRAFRNEIRSSRSRRLDRNAIRTRLDELKAKRTSRNNRIDALKNDRYNVLSKFQKGKVKEIIERSRKGRK